MWEHKTMLSHGSANYNWGTDDGLVFVTRTGERISKLAGELSSLFGKEVAKSS